MANYILLLCLVCPPSVFALQCYENEAITATNCLERENDVAAGIADVVAGIWDLANHLENQISGTDWIKRISEHIKQITGGRVDLENRESNSKWVKTVLGKLDFNLGRHCWVTYSRSTGETQERGCGRTGLLGQVGGRVLKWFQEDNRHVLAGTDICFSVPLQTDTEMCLCKTDDCNEDKTTAKKSLHIADEAEALKCSGSDCPVTDLSSVLGEKWSGFNSACYKKDNEEKEHCFTTEGIYDEKVVRSARLVQAKSGENSAEGFTFTQTSGSGRAGGSGGFLFASVLLMVLYPTYGRLINGY